MSIAKPRIDAASKWCSAHQHLLGWDTNMNSHIGFGNRLENGAVLYSATGHQLTFGKTGSGKAVNSAIPQALTYAGSMICFDPKGEIAQVTRKYREQTLGQKIVHIAPFDGGTGGIDPLAIFRFTKDTAFDHATSIATILAGSVQRSAISRGTSNDDFWMDSGINLLTGVIGAAIEGKLGDDNSLNAINKLLKSDDVVYNLAVLLDTKKPSPEFNSEIAAFLQLTDVTRSGVLATTQSYLRGLSSEGVASMLSKTTFDIEGFINATQPTTIYITIPPEKMVSHARLIKLIFGSLITALFSRKFIPRHKTVIQLDEAACLGSFDPLRMLLTLSRGQGVICHSFWQDLAQIQHNYSDWQTILNNHGVIRMLGCSNFGQAVAMANIFGVSPGKLMELEPDEQGLFVDGTFQRCIRINYLTDKLFAKRFATNTRYIDPFNPGPEQHGR